MRIRMNAERFTDVRNREQENFDAAEIWSVREESTRRQSQGSEQPIGKAHHF